MVEHIFDKNSIQVQVLEKSILRVKYIFDKNIIQVQVLEKSILNDSFINDYTPLKGGIYRRLRRYRLFSLTTLFINYYWIIFH